MKIENETITLDDENARYVIRNPYGVSCLGYAVLDRRAKALAKELGEVPEGAYGTLEAFHGYARLLDLAEARHRATGWRSQSQLTPELIGKEGKRVEVLHKWPGSQPIRERFRVGKSTGFIPCHIELSNRRSIAGPPVALGEIIEVREIEPR